MTLKKSHMSKRFGILNHIGTIWTPETFDTLLAAQDYLDRARKVWPNSAYGLTRHKVVPVRVTVTPILKKSP